MLTCRIMAKRVQFFPSDTVQILGGNVTPSLLCRIHRKICHLLNLCNLNPLPQVTDWKVNNIVSSFNFKKKFHFKKMKCNKHFSFEPELFPAALISKWTPAHVTLFHNGKGMITGVKSEDDARHIIKEIPNFLQSNHACLR